MSLHKLTAGSGYDYLTRQVAVLDATDKGHTGLASYYTEKGETPGVWVGSGLRSIDGLDAGDVVTADQMHSLFGSGHHPLATDRIKQLDLRIGRPGVQPPSAADYRDATRLGTPYRVYTNDVSPFRAEVARRIAALNEANGLPGDWPVPAGERSRVRTDVAIEMFRAEYGRAPVDARELAATIAQLSRSQTVAVAGFDLTFSPVKSVSVLWAVAEPHVAAAIERAHRAAVKDALDFIESTALFSRRGANGVRQVDVRGLVATAFTHRDSRAGDPDLHTHVAIANKVQTLDGSWLAIDGRPLHKAVVSASETYNTALERHLVDTLSVRFAERPADTGADARKRPVREIVGVDPDLNRRFSKRRVDVEDRRKILAARFQTDHGRPPTPIETIQLAQQATLETRDAKHEPRSLAEQRDAWLREAVEVLGSPGRVQEMVHSAVHPPRNPASQHPDLGAQWLDTTAQQILAVLEGKRTTWQYWHVYAEAQRQIRATLGHTSGPPGRGGRPVVDRLVAAVLDDLSVRIARPVNESADIQEPAQLRRVDGCSMYAQAGADLFTSVRTLDAERRLVAAAGRHDGHAVAGVHVDQSLARSTAAGVRLNPGQATLVTQMATSGARLQLAIAPAGSGKTTAMRALANAWASGGGTVIGLAPSAAAADGLRSQIDHQTDTLAKLTHSLHLNREDGVPLPEWVAAIDATTLVVIDEAGMADTVSLDQAVSYVLGRGGSVRLIGDDQQLASIGAGGVLRDIQTSHGALHLSELLRFKDPAEGAASLALREGRPEALGFHLDRGRIHVGDLTTMTSDAFTAWQTDRNVGLDSIMLAPTRDLVRELNYRAREARLAAGDATDANEVGPTRVLADGNTASRGDLVITRRNDRDLRTSSSDWVKNGDRWTVLDVHSDGSLTAQHQRHRRVVRLPSMYVADAVELGYACTVHTAQGVTADSMHGLATGEESRQQIYTMLTRGSTSNHVYLQVLGDGDPHSVIHPSSVRPLTAVDVLEQMLARDDSQPSATTLIRTQHDPAVQLGDATQRYLDSLYVAAEDLLRSTPANGSSRGGGSQLDAIEHAVTTLTPGLYDEPAWPTLRASLILVSAAGADAVEEFRLAASGDLSNARDRAAVIEWRIDLSGTRDSGSGPLPWLHAVPAALATDPHWGSYLRARANLVTSLAEQVHRRTSQAGVLPPWSQNGLHPDIALVADIEVWRAATQVAAEDRRPTGPRAQTKAAARWQQRLDRTVAGDAAPALHEWRHLLNALAPQIRDDAFTPLLAERLAAVSRSGIRADQLLRNSAAAGPLPVEHAAAALWWRMASRLTPAVATQLTSEKAASQAVSWLPRLTAVLGDQLTNTMRASSSWPALVSNIDHGLRRGWPLEHLLNCPTDVDEGPRLDSFDRVDPCQALVWRTSVALDTAPDDVPAHAAADEPPHDAWTGREPDPLTFTHDPTTIDWSQVIPEPYDEPRGSVEPDVAAIELEEEQDVQADLARLALIRDLGPTPIEPTDADVRLWLNRAEQWDHCPVSRERMVEINEMSLTYYEHHFRNSWGREYLNDRLGADITGDERFRPGQAPVGWNNLVDQLRNSGVTDTEMLVTGVATQVANGPRTGHLIDRFRDRVVFPIVHNGDVLGFVGRRNPNRDDDPRVPKYLNTPDTALFHKGAQLFGVINELIDGGATPVIVEGPLDAIAVTLASADRYLGVAPLGTALTGEQATQLATIGRNPVVATDADPAGWTAAQRDFWILAARGLDPGLAPLPSGLDPADVLRRHGPASLTSAIARGQAPEHALGEHVFKECLAAQPQPPATLAAIRVLAARPSGAWQTGLSRLATGNAVPGTALHSGLRDALTRWNADPIRAASSSAELHLRLLHQSETKLSASDAIDVSARLWRDGCANASTAPLQGHLDDALDRGESSAHQDPRSASNNPDLGDGRRLDDQGRRPSQARARPGNSLASSGPSHGSRRSSSRPPRR